MSYTPEIIHNIIINFLSEVLEEKEITLTTDLKTLGIGSVLYMELAVYLDRNFQIQSNPSRFYGLSTIEDISAYLLQDVDQSMEKENHSSVKQEKNIFSSTQKVESENVFNEGDIAIIGYSFRLPGASTKEELWKMLVESKSAITQMPQERWTWPTWVHPTTTHRGINQGGYIKDIDKFDASFFRVSPREAELIDPQQRLLLELSWELLETAGYKPSTLKGSKTGVYIGASGSDYELLLREQASQTTLTGTGTALAILANRLSHFYDLDGPSMLIDTACSSSLVAIHEAIKSIKLNQCTQAIVGGIHLMCHPSRSLSYYESNMLSRDGRCYTFDEKANGYVRAEGAVLMLLKPLSQAIVDGDKIEGIIKSTAVNHGGQTGGLTVPNPTKQSKLIEEAYNNAHIDITTVSYIEAHGTGTSLGDPIEINGLTAAFKNLQSNKKSIFQKPWCGLGSIKTNVGHLEAASGMAGMLKVLLSMQYQQLPPTINFERLNSKIELEGSPFYIQHELKTWQTKVSNEPLRAGVSSFGIGGANAHVVLESFNPDQKILTNLKINTDSFLFVLSAKNTEQLKIYVKKIIDHIEKTFDINVAELCYTLQTAREAIEERLAIVVNDKEELNTQLHNFLEGKTDTILTSNIKKNKSDFILKGKAGQAYVKEAIQEKEIVSLAQLWVKGVDIDWNLFYPENKPNKISLPTYPFARERYWIPTQAERTATSSNSKLHPLLHSNESDLNEQKYISVFSGQENFFVDHRVREEKVLPGVAYLELAREAGFRSIHQPIKQLKDVSWLSPIRVNDNAQKIQISLHPSGEAIAYEIYSVQGEEVQIHSQGKLSKVLQQSPPQQNIAAIQSRLHQSKNKEQCYVLFKDMGLRFGSSFQGIEVLYYNGEEALSKIYLPKEENYILQPGILDSALQTCIGLSFDKPNQTLSLPFSVQEVNIYQHLPENIWCYVRKSKHTKIGSKIIHYDIDLLNEVGEILLSFKDFAMLPMDGFSTLKPTQQLEEEKPNTHLYSPIWQETLLTQSSHQTITPASPLILLAGGNANLADKLKEILATEVEVIKADNEESYYIEVFEKIKEKLQQKTSTNLTVVYPNTDHLHYSFILGLLKTAHIENPKITGKTIGVDNVSITHIEELIKIIEAEKSAADIEVRYTNGKREIKNLQPLNSINNIDDEIKIKEGGVYLVTGGAGGLGKIFATYISNTKNTHLILTGRSVLSEAQQKIISAIPNATHYRCDVSDKKGVKELIQTIKKNYKKLDGIIHSAGVIEDNFIIKKTTEEIQKVLSPKIQGVKNLDEATKDEVLDFIIYFSSVAAVMGNIGQADYASANAYLDDYAQHRNALKQKGQRQGKTISINWPLWKEGGMQIDAESEKYLEKQWGMQHLPTEEGIMAFEILLNKPSSQAIVAYGKESEIAKTFATNTIMQLSTQHTSTLSEEKTSKLREASTTYIKTLIAKELKLTADNLELEVPFEEYGMDSIIATRLNNCLEEVFGDLPKILFFEYQTLEALIEYFIKEHYHTLQTLTGCKVGATKKDEDVSIQYPVLSTFKSKKRFLTTLFNPPLTSTQSIKDVAIIGLSGRYPGAKNVNQFWENLKQGKDSITEIPKDRWDMDSFYDKEKGQEGKSYSKWGGFIADVDKFDPLFFNISPREAEKMDPQERLFLQTVWEAIEDAGYTRSILQGISKPNIKTELGNKVGVYAGVMYEEYQLFGAEETLKGNPVALWANASNIANRISYFFNFHGPSMAVDTMCSSSLTAIHLACESIQNGNCALAIAGGVNVSIHPNKYIMLSQNAFLSSKGKCESFGEGGEGYVPSEGVGAVLLKPLHQAVLDGDHIYGIIKATSVNHGGKTNGYTVPNPSAQVLLIQEAIQKAGIEPEDISYIEAHGTGTSLGDPIEIAGLTKALKTDKKQYCKIGSVKSNIGHCESAAGISGLTKVLLQLKHKQLVPSLHSTTLNPNIDFTNSPFKVQQELEEWTTENNKPRIAGISSFGAGGSNAHIVIEEYQHKPKTAYSNAAPAIIVLSAKNVDRLKEQAENLKQYISANTEIEIYDIAYTLQTGREAMEERLAIVVNDKEELVTELHNFLEGKTSNFLSGNIKKNKTDFLLEGEAGKGYIEIAIRNKESKSLAQLWVKGVTMDWDLLYPNQKPNKISLPTYPFAKERYWIPTVEQQTATSSNSQLHPLLHINESDLSEQKYSSVFTGKESFLIDHKVKEEKVLPGVAYLELAREAGFRSIHQQITQIKDVSWLNPVKVNSASQKIEISLYPSSEAIVYEVNSQQENGNQLHSQGKLSTIVQQAPRQQDIVAIQTRLPLNKNKEECYRLFKNMGLQYGTSFQGIEALYYNEEEALSKIHLPKEENYILQPGILDSALQTSLAFNFDEKDQPLVLPFSIKEINIYQTLPETIWCYVSKKKSSKIDSTINNYDIVLLNEQGAVLLNIVELLTLPVEGFSQSTPTKQISFPMVYTSVWERYKINISLTEPTKSKHLLITGNTTSVLSTTLTEVLKHKHNTVEQVIALTEELPSDITDVYLLQGLVQNNLQTSIIQRIEQQELAVFRCIKQLLASSYKEKVLNITVFTHNTQAVLSTDKVQVAGSGIIGLIGSLAKEQPQWNIRMIDIDDNSVDKINLEKTLTTPYTKQGNVVAYRNGYGYAKSLYPTNLDSNKTTKFKNKGVYVILGGAGGLGKVTTEYLVQKYNAEIIWLGRSALSEKIIQAQDQIEKIGKRPIYIQCDASDESSVQKAYQQIKSVYTTVDGLFHSAIVLNDMLIKNMSEKDFRKTFDPKALASHYLVEAFAKEPLDFICFYSSVLSQLCPAGQSNYAAGGTYEDSYAQHLRTVYNVNAYTINWGYWGEVGVATSAFYQERMASLGFGTIDAAEGVQHIEQSLSNGIPQVTINKFIHRNTPGFEIFKLDKQIQYVDNITPLHLAIPTISAFKDNSLAQQSLSTICYKGLLQIMLELELEEKTFNAQSITEIRTTLGIAKKYDRLWYIIMHVLEQNDYIKRIANRLQVPQAIKQEVETFNVVKSLEHFLHTNPDYKAYAQLLTLCLTHFKEILTGKQLATDIIFPQGSLDNVSDIYKNNYQADYFNTLLASIIAHTVAENVQYLQAGKKIRILEVGAGTGGSSEVIFKALTPYKEYIEYIYTDLSKSFLLYAEEHYRYSAPYIQTTVFNIEQCPTTQRVAIGSCDIIIGTNVVHATKNIANTLNNIKAVLKKDGLLLLNELAKAEIYDTLTFGLLDGWWLYEDEEIRLPGSPALSQNSWIKVLTEVGFTDAQYAPSTSHLSQQIVIAKSDGKIMPEQQAQNGTAEKTNDAEKKNYINDNTIATSTADIQPLAEAYLKKIFSNVLKIGEYKIDVESSFESLGIDSILIGVLSKELSKDFESVPATTFFEYRNIRELSAYFLTHHATYFKVKESLIKKTEVKPFHNRLQQPYLSNPKKDKQTNNQLSAGVDKTAEDIAIIGLSGRYPGANNTYEFWENLKSGKDSIIEIPKDRWDIQKYYDEQKGKEGKINSKYGGFIDGVAEFDPLFFNISPKEAERMDPQERLFLQTVWETIEDAGYTAKELSQSVQQQKSLRTGVYVGVMYEEYQLYGTAPSEQGTMVALWGSPSSVANRVSYFFDLDGPSMAVDTMCSSSLTAIHLACKDLRLGEIDIAIAGGVNVSIHPNKYLLLSQNTFLSTRGKCESFSIDGEGFVPAEGVGAVLLKPLHKAEADGDRIYGIIKATAVNHGGRANGYTVPNPRAQSKVIEETIKKANVKAEDISYIEAHGTGTSLGDPVEIAGLNKAFQTNKKQYCSIGSVKSNIGHCESAAGIAGLTKVLLQLQYKQLVPSLHSTTLNPHIDFTNSPFKVQQQLEEWTVENNNPRIAGISSFGAGGSNAHIIVEEYQIKDEKAYTAIDPAIILLSAKDKNRLKEQVANLKNYLLTHQHLNLYDIAYTLQIGREAMEERLAMVVKGKEELLTQLDNYTIGKTDTIFIGNINKDKSELLLEGEAGKAYIESAVKNKEIKTLAQLWVKGVQIDWSLLYPNQKPNKISLPTYPFEKKRYWFDNNRKFQNKLVNEEVQISTVNLEETNTTLSNQHSIELKVSLSDLKNKNGLNKSPSKQKDISLSNNDKKIEVSITHQSTQQFILQDLKELLKNTLYLEDDIEEDKPFQELGLDSITGVELSKNIHNHFQIKLEAIKLYAYPTLTTLAAYISEKLSLASSNDNYTITSAIENPVELDTVSKKFNINTTPPVTLNKVEEALNIPPTDYKYHTDERIAIIGASGRYPKSETLEKYWENLSTGVDCVEEVLKDRWNVDAYYKENGEKKGELYCKWLGALQDVDKFDPLFFGISPLEAECMDPQQRIFVEESWKALEDAGYSRSKLDGINCGTYVGIMGNEYANQAIKSSDGQNLAQIMTGNSSSIFASRLAYLLNLKGPSIAIDTACSSSLVSVHLACQALRNKEIDMAVTGGVTLYLGVESYQQMCAAGMLSKEGKCKTFDSSADGFVPGEGAGVVVLKRLSDAIKEGDDIKGIIIGSGINQDGKTNGITAPNLNAQIDLLKNIYTKFNLNPETITYVEAHGTGTKLGDPIEVEALTKAFQSFTNKQGYCGIGSVKTNIGHTSAAAGVASIQKILLQLKHHKIAPSIHYKQENEHINFSDSPFYVNTTLKEWIAVNNQPRRAAVSSFGFSGTNAHIVIEEYQPKPKIAYSSTSPAIIVLSAKSMDRLKEQAINLKQYLSTHPHINLYDIAYTLQIGREAMEERLALVVRDKEELVTQLKDFSEGKIGNFFIGNIKKNKTDFIFKGKEYTEVAIKNKDMVSIAQLWIKGAEIDWNLLYPNQKPNKISLPTYPFARERYWIPTPTEQTTMRSENKLHPLLHSNESDLSEQKYSSVFTGKESFLMDHQVGEEKLLPGVAYLELAREAGFRSIHQPITQLKDVSWLSPIRVNDNAQKIQISLHPSGEAIAYEIYSVQGEEVQIHSQGKLSTITQLIPPQQNIAAIQSRLHQNKNKEQCYTLFKDMGLHYGTSFQGIEVLYYNEEEALSKISLPKAKEYILQPGILDSALQTCIGLSFNKSNQTLSLPFSVQEVNIYQHLPENIWCYARKSNHNKIGSKIIHYDIDVLNDQGEVLFNFKDFITLSINGFSKITSDEQLAEEQPSTYLYSTTWQENLLTESSLQTITPTSQLILLAGGSADLADKLKEVLVTEVEVIQADNEENYYLEVFEKTKEKLQQKTPTNITVVYPNEDYIEYSFISGLLKTAHIENPKITGKVVGIDHLCIQHVETIKHIMETEQNTTDTEVRYTNGKREIKNLGFTGICVEIVS